MTTLSEHLWIIPLAICIFGMVANFVHKTLRRIEHKLDRISRHVGITDYEPSVTVVQYIRAGNYTKAIREYSRQTGVDTTYAQEVIEPYWNERLSKNQSQ